MEKRVWILGASDPEMEAIESLLRECGENVQYAEAGGYRVHPGNAYHAEVPELPPGAIGYAVECIGELPKGWVRIDHHCPGDPGYGRPPEEFLEASSIGQVCRVLGVEPSPELRLTAAADHCLAAAYAGECPGVDPDELMQWRVESRAAFQRRSVEEVLADVERARALVAGAFRRELLPHVEVRDLRGQSIPELPEAACREGVAVLATTQDSAGREKVLLVGNNPPAVVRAFLEHWAPRHGLVDLYGDPARGFAGGYLR